MKYPGDIIYFLMYVGPDVLMVSFAILIIAIGAIWYFARRRKLKTDRPEDGR